MCALTSYGVLHPCGCRTSPPFRLACPLRELAFAMQAGVIASTAPPLTRCAYVAAANFWCCGVCQGFHLPISERIAHFLPLSVDPSKTYGFFDGFAQLASGLSCGLAGLAAGMAIGIVGDAGVRYATTQRLHFWKFVSTATIQQQPPTLEEAIVSVSASQRPRSRSLPPSVCSATAQQPKLFVGMILILIFAEALALYGLIVGIILSQKHSKAPTAAAP